jgi:hypothetical protein
LAQLVEQLSKFDAATAAQAAHLWQTGPRAVAFEALAPAAANSPPAVKAGLERYFEAWRRTQLAAAER